MKKFLVILCLILFSSSVIAEINSAKINKLPQGTFKKARNGNIVQYDNNGKKIGVYKLNNGSLVRIK